MPNDAEIQKWLRETVSPIEKIIDEFILSFHLNNLNLNSQEREQVYTMLASCTQLEQAKLYTLLANYLLQKVEASQKTISYLLTLEKYNQQQQSGLLRTKASLESRNTVIDNLLTDVGRKKATALNEEKKRNSVWLDKLPNQLNALETQTKELEITKKERYGADARLNLLYQHFNNAFFNTFSQLKEIGGEQSCAPYDRSNSPAFFQPADDNQLINESPPKTPTSCTSTNSW